VFVEGDFLLLPKQARTSYDRFFCCLGRRSIYALSDELKLVFDDNRGTAAEEAVVMPPSTDAKASTVTDICSMVDLHMRCGAALARRLQKSSQKFAVFANHDEYALSVQKRAASIGAL
jgi:hypothetical protein